MNIIFYILLIFIFKNNDYLKKNKYKILFYLILFKHKKIFINLI